VDLALPSARAQQVLERLSLDGFGRHAPGAEVRNYCGVRATQRGYIRVTGQVEAVAFGQPGRSVCSPHALLNVARRLLDHTHIP
jgi:hypothetical protein